VINKRNIYKLGLLAKMQRCYNMKKFLTLCALTGYLAGNANPVNAENSPVDTYNLTSSKCYSPKDIVNGYTAKERHSWGQISEINLKIKSGKSLTPGELGRHIKNYPEKGVFFTQTTYARNFVNTDAVYVIPRIGQDFVVLNAFSPHCNDIYKKIDEKIESKHK
jgi:hypothetical protein